MRQRHAPERNDSPISTGHHPTQQRRHPAATASFPTMANLLKATLLTAIVLLANGCGDNDTETSPTTTSTSTTSTPTQSDTTEGTDPDETSPDDTTPPPIEDAVITYTRAFGQGDADTAWNLVSARCQADLARTQYTAAVTEAGRLYPDLDVTDITAAVDGQNAAVTYSTTAADDGIAYVGQPWVVEDGGWRWDAC